MPCEFFLIRYVPDVVKGEFVNIGVLLREAEGADARTQVRFTRDWGRVRCLHADADTGLLEGLEHEIAERLRAGTSPRDPKAVFDVLNDTLSNSVQMSEGRATLAENLPAEMELLLRLYVEPMKVAKLRIKSGRAALAATMRREFERTGAWPLMRKRIAASSYTRPGDPLKLDCGYRSLQQDGPVRIFQAVTLDSDAEAAKVLAYSAPQLSEGVRPGRRHGPRTDRSRRSAARRHRRPGLRSRRTLSLRRRHHGTPGHPRDHLERPRPRRHHGAARAGALRLLTQHGRPSSTM